MSFIVGSSKVVRGRARRSTSWSCVLQLRRWTRSPRAFTFTTCQRPSWAHGDRRFASVAFLMSQSWATLISGGAVNTQIYPGLISIYTADTNPLSNWHLHSTSASAADDSRPDVIPLTLAATYVNVREHANWGNVRLLVRG